MDGTAPQGDSWLIRGACLADPSSGEYGIRDVLVAGGRVERIGAQIGRHEAEQRGALVIDASGLWLWPGLVDLHVHLRDPGFTHKETIASGGRAAARGGYTAVVCEPNTCPPIDTPERALEVAERARRDSPVRVYVKAAMTVGREGRRPTDIEGLARVPSVVALSDDGDPVTRLDVMEGVCRAAARAGLPLSPHCEDSERALADRRAGAAPGFEPAAPYANERRYIERDLELARRWGCPIHFSHVSLAESVGLIRRFREGMGHGAQVSYELTPHHLLLSAADFAGGEAPRVNPPLRAPADRLALQDALAGGAADAVASDHAPHTVEDKAGGASGLIGLETTLGLVLTHFVHAGRMSVLAAARVLSARPAQVFGLPGGSVQAGRPADLVLIDPDEEWTVRADEFASLSRNTPYEGWNLRGRAVGVLVAGRMVHARDSILSRTDHRHGSARQ